MQVRWIWALAIFLFGPSPELFALAILPLAGLAIWRGNFSALRTGSHTTWQAGMRAELQDGVELA